MSKNYLVVDKDKTEYITYGNIPERIYCPGLYYWLLSDVGIDNFMILPKGSILKLIGRELTWADEPYLYE